MSRDPLLESSASSVEQIGRAVHGPDQTLLRQFEICQRLGISDQTWMNWRKRGRAPEPVRDVPGVPRWRVSDIEAFERDLVTVRPGRRSYFASHRRLSSLKVSA